MRVATLDISLPDDMKAFIDAECAQRGFDSASDYLVALIRVAQRRGARQALESKLSEGLRGTAVEMTREDWLSIEREALEGLAGEPLRQ
jgi:antitoxin ParD1/3/4